MNAWLVMAAPANQLLAVRLCEALQAEGVGLHPDSPLVVATSSLPRDWRGRILALASTDPAGRASLLEELRKSARGFEIVVADMAPNPPPMPFARLDLSAWRGGRDNPRFTRLVDRLRLTPQPRPILRSLRGRLGGIAGGLAIFGGALGFFTLSEPVCKLTPFKSICSQFGWGGQPTPRQKKDFETARRESCTALRAFAADSRNNAQLRAEAGIKIAAKREALETHWSDSTRTLPVFVYGPFASDRQRAQIAADLEKARTATAACQYYEGTPGWRLVSAVAETPDWQCSGADGHWRCYGRTDATCRLRVAARVDIGDCR